MARNRLRRQKAAKRDRRRISTLHHIVSDLDGGLAESLYVIGPRERDNRHCRDPLSDQDRTELHRRFSTTRSDSRTASSAHQRPAGNV